MPTSTVSDVFPSERKVSRAGSFPVKKVAKVGREVSKADVTGKKTAKDKRKISEAGSLSEEKVAKAGRKVSGAGDVPDKKTSKAVASEPREPHTKRLKEELEEAEKAISTASRKKTPQQLRKSGSDRNRLSVSTPLPLLKKAADLDKQESSSVFRTPAKYVSRRT